MTEAERMQAFIEADYDFVSTLQPTPSHVAEKYAEWSKTPQGKEAYQDIVKIFSGYEPEIVIKIVSSLTDDRHKIAEIVTDETFLKIIKPWFQGISWDGSRAQRVVSIVYMAAYEKLEALTESEAKPAKCDIIDL